MNIDIYQSNSNPAKFMSVAAGVPPSSFKVPDTDYVSVRRWKTNIDLAVDRFVLDSAAAEAAIQAVGFYLHAISTP
ncbi:hypothetical protein RBA41_31210 [Massilia sp. CCM 9210]|uniref:hypothetical protein n=1 Tax=Massilia scottii TaxID=3057166 RepID=UPI0027965F79|nr:hypothetical protein [Massilia sp. CCM 9210]MDQ1817779.1 hypothetical protein [Massilia sp. CCM 9210]